MTNMKIPAIRKRLHQLADEHGIPELAELAEATRRRLPTRKAPRKLRNALTDQQKGQIDQLAVNFPHMPMRDIAARVGTDQGRVSEYLARRQSDVVTT